MLIELKQTLQSFLESSYKDLHPDLESYPTIDLEVPGDKNHGDFSCNVALKSAKLLRKAPLEIANQFVEHLNTQVPSSEVAGSVAKIEVKAPGFINFFISEDSMFSILEEILSKKDQYGRLDVGQKEKIQIEFVSANPTGPLTVAHARQAAVGDALVRIMQYIGFDAAREYYVNDGGNQINILGRSLELRMREILGEQVDFPEDCYQGEYIKDMAGIFMEANAIDSVDDVSALDPVKISSFGATYLLDVIKKDLEDFGVVFDVWSHESKIATQAAIEELIKDFQSKGLAYEHEGALWFKTTDFGDDKDRVLRKSDGSFTYLTPDIVYHKNKFSRGFNRVFDILGPDHHGYINRIKAAACALGKNADDLEVLIVQLASIYRDGQEISMSTRQGQFISLREVIDEVGVDAARYFFLMRHIKAHLEFDLELAKKQSSENPVYYIQYAHARVFSINAKAKEAGILLATTGFSKLTDPAEADLIKKLGGLSKTLEACYNQRDPYSLGKYLHEVAILFHKFYDSCRVVTDDTQLSSERLGLCNATRYVLAVGLNLLGLTAPEQM